MLRAVAVYQIKSSGNHIDFALIKSECISNDRACLDEFEDDIFAKSKDAIISGNSRSIEKADKYGKLVFPIYYFLYRPDLKSRLYVMCANNEIDDISLNYLFKNLEHADLRSTEANVTLEQILQMPGTYSKLDMQAEAILAKVDKANAAVLNSHDLLFSRGARTRIVLGEAGALNSSSVDLSMNAQKLENKDKCFNCSY